MCYIFKKKRITLIKRKCQSGVKKKAIILTNDSTETASPIDPGKYTTTPIKTLGFWGQVRRFLIFQFKLYVDAFRDFVLSFLSFWAFLFDLIFHKKGDDRYFESVLKLGRRTERAINLFNQYDPDVHDDHSVDGFIKEVEGRLRKDQNI